MQNCYGGFKQDELLEGCIGFPNYTEDLMKVCMIMMNSPQRANIIQKQRSFAGRKNYQPSTNSCIPKNGLDHKQKPALI